MSKVAIPRRAGDLVSAAMRHVQDALSLLPDSPDQSWHLAGFGPECARKACLGQSWLDKTIGHDLSEVSDHILEWAISLDVRAWRYRIDDLALRHPKLAEWTPNSRYEPTGKHMSAEAQELVEQASTLTIRLAKELWMDGCFERVD